MPIATSDGKLYESHYDMLAHAIGLNSYHPEDVGNGKTQSSSNVEDDRTQADRWGDAFGPSEGGPPEGIDPRLWYASGLSAMPPNKRETYIKNGSNFMRPEDVARLNKGLSSEEDLSPIMNDPLHPGTKMREPYMNQVLEGRLLGRTVEDDFPQPKPDINLKGTVLDSGQFDEIKP